MDTTGKGSLTCVRDYSDIDCKDTVEKFKSFFHNIDNSVVMIELNDDGKFGRFLEVKDTVCTRLNCSKDELLKKTPYDIKDIDSMAIEEILKRLVSQGETKSDIIYIGKKGEKYPFKINSSIFSLDEKKIIIVTVHNDVNMKKIERLIEKIYEQTEERYRKLVEMLPDAVHVKYNGKIVFSNEAGAKLFGYSSKEDIIGRFDEEITHPDYQKISLSRGNKIRNKQENIPISEQKGIRADGEIIDVEVVSTAITFNEDKAILSVIRDITERKKWDRMLGETLKHNKILLSKAMELDRERTEFFSNISHEFKTPLNVILGSIQLLENMKDSNSLEDSGHIFRYISIMKQNCYRLLRLINNLIDINKADSKFLEARFRNHDIINIIEDITLSVADFGKNKGLKIIFDTEVEEKVIACDVDKIERIMLNLLSNSIKYTGPSGKIFVNICDKNSKISISIKDTGIGIPKEKLKTIFDRFEQIDSSLRRRKEGSGIGLSLVKSFVELHQGKIWAESKIGSGTQFFIELPAKQIYEEESNCHYTDYSSNLVERINIEFSDIYS